ncbi:MAG: metallophosphoesterase [Deltaproteobacteria bacterium]|nr:metallophosphoesterase [Deltaproteobacteria bacterium]
MSRSRQLRILHLSDLHAGSEKDRYPITHQIALGQAWDSNLTKILEDAPIDFVFLTGDVANEGHWDEYIEATQFVQRTLSWLRLEKDRFFVVPGNHDIQRSVCEGSWNRINRSASDPSNQNAISEWMAGGREKPAELENEWRDEVLERQANYRKWVSSNEGLGRPDLDPQKSPHSRLGFRRKIKLPQFSFPIHVIGFDTAWLYGQSNNENKIMLTEKQVLTLLRKEDGSALEGLRLVLMHHPLEKLADMDLCRRNLRGYADLVMRGHFHETGIDAWSECLKEYRIATGCLSRPANGALVERTCQVATLELANDGKPSDIEFHFRSFSEHSQSWYDNNRFHDKSEGGRIHFKIPQFGQEAARSNKSETLSATGVTVKERRLHEISSEAEGKESHLPPPRPMLTWDEAWNELCERAGTNVANELIGRDTELDELNELLDAPHVGAVLICGPKGIGKKRVLLEVTRNRAADTVFASDPSHLTREALNGIAGSEPDKVLVIQETCFQQIDELINLNLLEQNLKVMVVLSTAEAISIPGRDQDERINVFQLRPLSEEASMKVLRSATESENIRLDYSLESWVVNQCGGFPGALLAAAARGESLREQGTEFMAGLGEEFERKIRGYIPDNLMKVLGLLSLLTRVGVERAERSEIEHVCQHFGAGIELNEVLNGLEPLQKAGLVQVSGAYASVVAPFLANRLATRTLLGRFQQTWQLFSELEGEGKKRFMQRLALVKCDDVDRFWQQFLSSQDSVLALLSQAPSPNLLQIAARAVPREVANMIEQQLSSLTAEQRRAIPAGQRDALKWVVEETLFHKRSCYAALRSLALLAEVDTETTYANNAKGVFCECFKWGHPQFPMPLGERLEILKEVMSQDRSTEMRVVGLEAIKSAFALHGAFGMQRSEGRRPYDPQPKMTYGEIWSYFDELLDMLMTLAEQPMSKLSSRAVQYLPQVLADNAYQVPPKRSVRRFETAVKWCIDGTVPVPVAELSGALATAYELFTEKPDADEASADRAKKSSTEAATIRGLIDRLEKASFPVRLKRWAGSWVHGCRTHTEEGITDVSAEELKDLAKEAVSQPSLLSPDLWQWLLSPDAERAPIFFSLLGKEDAEHTLIDKIDEAGAEKDGAVAFAQYYHGLSTLDPGFVNSQLDKFIENHQVTGRAVVYAMYGVPGGDEAVDRVETLIRENLVEPEFVADTLAGAPCMRDISPQAFLRLLKAVDGETDERKEGVLDLYGMWIHLQRPLEGDLVEYGWRFLETLPETMGIDNYHVDRVAATLAEPHSSAERAFKFFDALCRRPLGRLGRKLIGGKKLWNVLCSHDRSRAIRVLLSSVAGHGSNRVFRRDDLSAGLDLVQDHGILVEFAGESEANALAVCDSIRGDQEGFWKLAFDLRETYSLKTRVIQALSRAAKSVGQAVRVPIYAEERLKEIESLLEAPATPVYAHPWLEELRASFLKDIHEHEERLSHLFQ